MRGLLHGEEVTYETGGDKSLIRFLDRELDSLNLENPVPIYVGANGPKALKLQVPMATGGYAQAMNR